MLKSVRLRNVYPIKDVQTFNLSTGVNFLIGGNGTRNLFKSVEKCLTAESLLHRVNAEDDSCVVCEFQLQNKGEEKYLTEYRCRFDLNGEKPVSFNLCVHVPEGDEECSGYTFRKLTMPNGASPPKELGLPGTSVEEITKRLMSGSLDGILSLLKANVDAFDEREASQDKVADKETVQIVKEGVCVLFGCNCLNMKSNCIPPDRTTFMQSMTESEKEEARKIIRILTDFDSNPFHFGQDSAEQFARNGTENTTLHPDGFAVAMVFAAFLASRCVRTIYMEQPEREMHPSMIRRLKDFMYPKLKLNGKTLVLSTLSPQMLSSTDCSNTFIFKRNNTEPACEHVIACSRLISENQGLKIPITETYLPYLFFKHKVFLVEGTHDRIFLKSLVTKIVEEDSDVKRILDNIIVQNSESMLMVLETLKRFVISLDIFQMDGATHIRKYNSACKALEIPRYFLLSKDAVYENGKSVNVDEKFNLQEDLENESFETVKKILSEKGVFVWGEGSLEDSLRGLLSNFPSKEFPVPDKKKMKLSGDDGDTASLSCSTGNVAISGHMFSENNEEILSWTDRLTKENIVIPIARKGKVKARHKLYANKKITIENINNSMKIFLQCCSSLNDDLVQLIRFLLHCSDKDLVGQS